MLYMLIIIKINPKYNFNLKIMTNKFLNFII